MMQEPESALPGQESAPVVLVTTRSFGRGSVDFEQVLTDAGCVVVRSSTTHDRDILSGDLRRASAWIAGVAPITEDLMSLGPNLRIIARYGVGVDAVDLAAAAARGIVVTNTPGANSAAVADHTLALILAAVRRVPMLDRQLRSGDWSVARTRELQSLVIGLVGAGRIGREVAKRLRAFGAAVSAYDPFADPEALRQDGLRPATLEELAATCDLVSLHAPGDAAVVTADWLAATRPGLILVNTARASLVDEDAVAGALRSGRLSCYAADALAHEGDSAVSPLMAPDLSAATILTPHAAAQTVEAVDNMGRAAATAVLDVLAGRTPPTVVHPPIQTTIPDPSL